VLRRTRPDLDRAVRCPGVAVVPVLAVLAAFYLMLNLPAATWTRFFVWMAIGFIVYFGYSARHSRLVPTPTTPAMQTAPPEKGGLRVPRPRPAAPSG
jgi:basic amino acid/polyamine antiporter, APA family